MMSRTLGAFFGGTTRGGHQGVDSVAFSLITPPNFGSGGGSCFPEMVVVALGEPGVPVICWAVTGTERHKTQKLRTAMQPGALFVRKVFPPIRERVVLFLPARSPRECVAVFST
jgi:hypothetical protein